MFVSKFIKLLGHYIRYPADLVLLPVSILFGYFHGLIKLYAACTLNVVSVPPCQAAPCSSHPECPQCSFLTGDMESRQALFPTYFVPCSRRRHWLADASSATSLIALWPFFHARQRRVPCMICQSIKCNSVLSADHAVLQTTWGSREGADESDKDRLKEKTDYGKEPGLSKEAQALVSMY